MRTLLMVGLVAWAALTGAPVRAQATTFDATRSIKSAASSPTPAGSGGISIRAALSTGTENPDCDGPSTLLIQPGDYVQLCYTVSNDSDHELDWHYLTDSFFGDNSFLDDIWMRPLPAHSSFQFVQQAIRFWRSVEFDSVWTSTDGPPPSYAFDDTAAFDFVDLTTSPTATVLVDSPRQNSNGTASTTMPFTFRFYEKPAINVLCVTFKGAVFVDQAECDSYPPFWDPYSGVPARSCNGYGCHHLMLVDWPSSGFQTGTVYVDTQGEAPNRRFIVEWSGMNYGFYDGDGITFEVVIDEGSSAITYQYQRMTFGDGRTNDDNGATSTVGIQRDEGRSESTHQAYLQYSSVQPVLTDGKAIRWTPGPAPFTAIASSTANAEIAAAAITVAPMSLSASAPIDGSATATLIIGNAGNIDLNWSVGGVAARAGTAVAPITSIVKTTPAGANVPAYGLVSNVIDDQGHSATVFDRFDANDSSMLNEVSRGLFGEPFQIGAFIDNDFSREYLLTNARCDDSQCLQFAYGFIATDGSFENTNGRQLGEGTSVAPDIVPFEYWHGMKWDATTQVLYAVASTDDSPSRTDLYAIDPSLGTPTWVARIDDVGVDGTKLLDIAIAPDGSMFGIDEWTDSLYAIDSSSGHVSLVGPTGLDTGDYDVQSMDFDQASGILYYAGYPLGGSSGIYTVDTATGAATLIGPVGDGTAAVQGLAIAEPGGPCVTAESVPWLSFTPATGTTAVGQTSEVSVRFDASGLQAGAYQATICVASNTPFKSDYIVPVTFDVAPQDAIFDDGFDG